MRAAVLRGGKFSVEDVPDPSAKGHQVVIRVTYCGICGSDLHAFRAGLLREGAVLGHEIVGVVQAVGPAVTRVKAGDRVTTLSAVPCDACEPCRAGRYRACATGWQIMGYGPDVPGGYADLVLSHEAVIETVPDGVDDLDAALNEPAIVGLHAVAVSRLRFGDVAAVIGAGPIGLLVLQSVLLATTGPVYVIEPSPSRRAMALRLGATGTLDLGVDDVGKFFLDLCEPGGPDVVFECAGARGTLQAAIELVRPGGQVVVPGVNMEEDLVNPLSMTGKECEIVASLGGAELFRTALEHLAAGRIKGRSMVTRVVGLDDVEAVFRVLGQPGDDDVKVLVAPGR